MKVIQLEYGLERRVFDAISTAVFDLIHDSLKNLSWYIIQEQLSMEMQVFIPQVITGQEQEALDGLPRKGKSHALSEIMKQGRCQL